MLPWIHEEKEALPYWHCSLEWCLERRFLHSHSLLRDGIDDLAQAPCWPLLQSAESLIFFPADLFSPQPENVAKVKQGCHQLASNPEHFWVFWDHFPCTFPFLSQALKCLATLLLTIFQTPLLSKKIPECRDKSDEKGDFVSLRLEPCNPHFLKFFTKFSSQLKYSSTWRKPASNYAQYIIESWVCLGECFLPFLISVLRGQ